ncbi:hypothetical protein HDU76_008776, partial [Blyttiomyces sp. JEL0837]
MPEGDSNSEPSMTTTATSTSDDTYHNDSNLNFKKCSSRIWNQIEEILDARRRQQQQYEDALIPGEGNVQDFNDDDDFYIILSESYIHPPHPCQPQTCESRNLFEALMSPASSVHAFNKSMGNTGTTRLSPWQRRYGLLGVNRSAGEDGFLAVDYSCCGNDGECDGTMGMGIVVGNHGLVGVDCNPGLSR